MFRHRDGDAVAHQLGMSEDMISFLHSSLNIFSVIAVIPHAK